MCIDWGSANPQQICRAVVTRRVATREASEAESKYSGGGGGEDPFPLSANGVQLQERSQGRLREYPPAVPRLCAREEEPALGQAGGRAWAGRAEALGEGGRALRLMAVMAEHFEVKNGKKDKS